MDKLLTITEAAARIGVSGSRISQLIGEQKLQAEKFGEGRSGVRLRESVVDAYIESRESRKIPEYLPV